MAKQIKAGNVAFKDSATDAEIEGWTGVLVSDEDMASINLARRREQVLGTGPGLQTRDYRAARARATPGGEQGFKGLEDLPENLQEIWIKNTNHRASEILTILEASDVESLFPEAANVGSKSWTCHHDGHSCDRNMTTEPNPDVNTNGSNGGANPQSPEMDHGQTEASPQERQPDGEGLNTGATPPREKESNGHAPDSDAKLAPAPEERKSAASPEKIVTQLSNMEPSLVSDGLPFAHENGVSNNMEVVEDGDWFSGSTGENSIAPQDISAYAMLQFENGEFYMNTYQVELGRPFEDMRLYSRNIMTFWPQSGGKSAGISNCQKAPGLTSRSSYSQQSSRSASPFLDRENGTRKLTLDESHGEIARGGLAGNPSALAAPHRDPTECPHVPIIDPRFVETGTNGISRRHLRIAYHFDHGYFEMEVLGRNGAFFCDDWVPQSGRARLRDGDVIQLAGVRMTFRLPPNQRQEEDTDTRTEATSHHMSMDFENESGEALEVTDESSSERAVRLPRPGEISSSEEVSDESTDDGSSTDQEVPPAYDSRRGRGKFIGKVPMKRKAARDSLEQQRRIRKKHLSSRHDRVVSSTEKRMNGVSAQRKASTNKTHRRKEQDDEEDVQESDKASDSGEESPVMVDLGSWGFHPAPPRKKGPGRPPKGTVSKRIKSQMIKDLKEKLGHPPTHSQSHVQSGQKANRSGNKVPNKSPNEEARDGASVADNARRKSADLENNSADKPENAVKQENEEPSPPPSPARPQRLRSDFTSEQLEKPQTCYAQTLYDILIEIPEGLTLQNVYQKVKDKWPYYEFELSSKGWESSVRHNLNQNQCFKKDNSNPKRVLWKADPAHPPYKSNRSRPPASVQRSPTSALRTPIFGVSPTGSQLQQAGYAGDQSTFARSWGPSGPQSAPYPHIWSTTKGYVVPHLTDVPPFQLHGRAAPRLFTRPASIDGHLPEKSKPTEYHSPYGRDGHMRLIRDQLPRRRENNAVPGATSAAPQTIPLNASAAAIANTVALLAKVTPQPASYTPPGSPPRASKSPVRPPIEELTPPPRSPPPKNISPAPETKENEVAANATPT